MARTCRKRKQVNSEISSCSSWYVGYAEDAESVEAIMKKFEELDKLQQETSCQSTSSNTQIAESHTQDDNDKILTQTQLEELFKRTSAFTVKAATQQEVEPDDLDDVELWRLEFCDESEWEEPDDYQIISDELEDEDCKSKIREKSGKSHRYKLDKFDKEGIIARYKVMQVQMTDRQGNYFFMKKKISLPDPNLPTYVRIPSNPIPRSWAKSITPLEMEKQTFNSRHYEANIKKFDLSKLGNSFQAILMDPPFLLPNEKMVPGKITIEEFSLLDILSVITHGFMFVWVEKQLTPKVLKVCEKWGFKYVENFAWIKLDLENKIARQKSKYFNSSKTTCLIMRKEGNVELRHQRNPDCEFDFIKPDDPRSLTQEKPDYIYNVIETMLPQASDPAGTKLLELWTRHGKSRKYWTTITHIE